MSLNIQNTHQKHLSKPCVTQPVDHGLRHLRANVGLESSNIPELFASRHVDRVPAESALKLVVQVFQTALTSIEHVVMNLLQGVNLAQPEVPSSSTTAPVEPSTPPNSASSI